MSGIKYIKLNRRDIAGVDHTFSLQELQNIRVKFADIGIVDYPVHVVAEFNDYYLYEIVTTNITSSTDFNYTNFAYRIETGSQNFAATGVSLFTYPISNIISSNAGYFDTSSYEYVFTSTPNQLLDISFHVSSSFGAFGPTFYFYSNYQGLLPGGSSGSGTSINFSGSYFFQTGERLKIQYGSIGPFTASNASWIQAQVTASHNSESLTILEPYLLENYEYSNCNPLINNVELNTFNKLYMDVDYTSDISRVVNFDQIINGSAYKSNVKSYYYSLRRHIYPRYNGTRVYTAVINECIGATASLSTSFYSGSYSGDVGYGKTTNINILDTTIFEFEWGGSTYPEIINSGVFKLSNIINVEKVVGNSVESFRGNDLVEIINPLTKQLNAPVVYSQIIDAKFPTGNIPYIYQYTTDVNINPNTQVITSEFGAPTKSNYWIPINCGTSSLGVRGPGANQIGLTGSFEVVQDSTGAYRTGSFITGSVIMQEVSASLSAGDRWFMSIYTNITSPIDGDLIPLTSSFVGGAGLGSGLDNDILASKGVYEVIYVIGNKLTTNATIGIIGDDIQLGTGVYGPNNYTQKGFLLWKAYVPVNGKVLMVDGDTLSGTGKGALLTTDTKKEVTDNLVYLTQKYGINSGRG